MKKKIIFWIYVFVLFVLNIQTIFSQSVGNISFELDISPSTRAPLGGNVQENGTQIRDRVQTIGVNIGDSGMVIIIYFKDGSTRNYLFMDIEDVDDGYGYTTWNNVRIANPNTGGFSSERFIGHSSIKMQYGTFSFGVNNVQTNSLVFGASGFMIFH